jgi:tRNA (guanine-N7-)-methyltransferase
MTEDFFRSHRQGGVRYGEILKEDGKKFHLDFEDGLFIPAESVRSILAAGGRFAPLNISEIFGGGGVALNVEIGIGNGDFIAHSAAELGAAETGGNWLGFEPVKEFFFKAVHRVQKEKLTNVRLIQFDAELFIRLLPPKSVDFFYINFPDPWPKRRHNKRRLLKTWFLELLRDRLKAGGRIITLTDHEDYAGEILRNFSETGGLVSEIEGGVSSSADGYYRTKYFRKFAENGKLYYFNYKLVNI